MKRTAIILAATLAVTTVRCGRGDQETAPAPSERPAIRSVRITMAALHQAGGVPPGWRFTVPPGDVAAGRRRGRSGTGTGCEACASRTRPTRRWWRATSWEEPYRERVGWLRCFRGIDPVTAITLLAELHGFQRFTTPRALMVYLGLVPSEHSSGEAQHRGSITKAGNLHARRLLIEAAWHYRHPPAIGKAQRRQGQPARVLAVADRAQQRLHRRSVA